MCLIIGVMRTQVAEVVKCLFDACLSFCWLITFLGKEAEWENPDEENNEE